jgi:hypothetical protein
MNTTDSTSEYLLLFRGNGWDRSLSPAELQETMSRFMSWFQQLSAAGTLKAGQPLLNDARIVSGKNGRTVADGPFAESKEAVGGYFLVKAANFDEAVAIAQQCPTLEYGAVVEVRPIAVECPTMHRVRDAMSQESALASV